MKTALITGITGQDGSYLTDFLLEKDYIIHGVVRGKSTEELSNLDHIDEKVKRERIRLHFADLTDTSSIRTILSEVNPDEIFNLGAQSHVGISFKMPEYTAEVCAVGVVRLLESLRQVCPGAKFYQASSSEMFGGITDGSLNEESQFRPRSPYASSKVFAHNTVVNYRSSYHLFAASGILFNHESPRRGKQFVTRKITYNLAKIKLGISEKFYLGNLDAKRDWGFAGDYVEAMWLMLQQPEPQDFVIATGVSHSVREFVEQACEILEIKLDWSGNGADEIGFNKTTGQIIIEIDPELYRPEEVDCLLGSSERAKNILGWQPKVKFDELVEMMCKEDYQQTERKLV